MLMGGVDCFLHLRNEIPTIVGVRLAAKVNRKGRGEVCVYNIGGDEQGKEMYSTALARRRREFVCGGRRGNGIRQLLC